MEEKLTEVEINKDTSKTKAKNVYSQAKQNKLDNTGYLYHNIKKIKGDMTTSVELLMWSYNYLTAS